ncbi:Hypothetical protein D9617_15g043210 [Elsinoe fawcettii]|nr:Hypothetical protein D9617_15g043210 [Elsinoe fawcettii]
MAASLEETKEQASTGRGICRTFSLDDDAVAYTSNEQSPKAANDFVAASAAWNVTINYDVVFRWRTWNSGGTFEDTIAKYALQGGSRNEREPFVFHCKKTAGCTQTYLTKIQMDRHELDCEPIMAQILADAAAEAVVNELVFCDEPGCKWSGKDDHARQAHKTRIHKYTLKECPDCTDVQMASSTLPGPTFRVIATSHLLVNRLPAARGEQDSVESHQPVVPRQSY